jgi:class 3 adenylate cyclase
MAASGLKDNAGPEDTIKMIRFAQGILQDVENFNLISGTKIEIRLGINTGSLVAGVIGKTKFIYDIWGDTVNVASRMESTCTPGKIRITESVKTILEQKYTINSCLENECNIKGKGIMKTYEI